MREESVDIIIPVYNAYDDLVKCMNSIKKWTDLNKHRIILIDDCSPDGRIAPYLDQIRSENCIVIHNEKNQGFSANINVGISYSKDRDVILLNSDTVVTKSWVEKLLYCAYCDPWIATVTPLSNNATLCSVPYFCKENDVPNGYTVDTYAELVERVSLKKYPVIPVAHGFCMLIKREVISVIGNFDAETFGKGYGEENDFCYRAIEAGYHHVMCDDTFILHTGTRSFADKEKSRQVIVHEKILDERYPDLMQAVREHCRDNPTGIIAHNIRMRTKLQESKNKKTILYLLQSDFREDAQDHIGGTQIHVKDLTEGLRKKYNILVAARNYEYLNVTFYTAAEEMFFQFYIGERPKFQKFRSTEFAHLYGKILDAFAVNCAHIHHISHMSAELFYEASKRKIPIFLTIHDYYFLCPNIKLLDENYQLCTDGQRHNCSRCLQKKLGIAQTLDYINLWRSRHQALLEMPQKIIVPSESAKQILTNSYPVVKEKIQVIGHGFSNASVDRSIYRESEKRSFHVAFLGAISQEKGFHHAVSLIKKRTRDISWYLFGYFEREVPELEGADFHDMGPYEREGLSALLIENQIDLICIFSIWPETFCYTLSEAIMAGVPVLVTDIGALGERVKHMGCGWVMPYHAASEELLECIISIKENREEYKRVWKVVRKQNGKTLEEMCREYDQLYQTVLTEDRDYEYDRIDNEWLITNYLMLNGRRDACARLQERLNSAERQLSEIYHSFSYQLLLKLVKVPIPFRRQLKEILLSRRYRKNYKK